jgi:SAM-dependent methyltransferase
VSLRGINGDLNQLEFEADRYDVIVALDLYRPRLVEQIRRALRTNGVVLYGARILPDKYAGNAASRYVKPGEFKTLFSDFKIMLYLEEEIPNQTDRMAYVIARKQTSPSQKN